MSVRVCQVMHGIVGGGSEQVVLNYCSRMCDIHFDLLYQYEPNLQILERFREAGISCIRIPDKVHHPLKHLWTMFRVFRKGDYDVVHCHLDWFLNSYVCFLAMLAGVKKRIAHHHQAYTCPESVYGSRIRLVNLPSHLVKNLISAIMCVPCKLFATHWLACGEAAAINGWGQRSFEKGRVTILPNAIDPERFKFCESARREIRVRYGIAENDFVVGHVGRFYPQKNHEFLIDAFAELHRRKANAKLLLLGDGPLQGLIEQRVESLGLSNAVFFAGLQKDSAPFYSAMDVFCFPSLWEGLPLTLVEAQYAGLPCLVSERITHEAMITDGLCWLSLDDVSAWVKSMALVKNRLRAKEINDRYNVEKCYKILERIYVER